MKQTKSLVLLIAFLLFHPLLQSHEVLTNWKTAKKANGIELSYRKIKVGDTLTTRQMQISFYLESGPEQIINLFKDAENLSKWSAGIKKCEILQKEENTWTTYSLYDIPWPFEQKDLITEYKMINVGDKFSLYLTSKPKKLPYYQHISRIEKYEGYWKFTPLANGKTKVQFYSVAFSKPIVPRFIQDPIIQSVLINSISKLKTLLA
jgi:hypothetical protein